MMRASVTNCAVIAALIDQPTTRRENRSMTAATYSQPSAVQTYVKSAIHLRLGADASKVRSSTFGATAPACRSPRSGGRRRRRGRARLTGIDDGSKEGSDGERNGASRTTGNPRNCRELGAAA